MLRITLTLFALFGLTACDRADSEDAPQSAEWSCSPDAAWRYHIGPDGMVLELCATGCTQASGAAICGG